MLNNSVFKLIIILISVLFSSSTFANNSEKKSRIYKINLQQEINSSSWLFVQNGFKESEEFSPDIILIHMNTYGGEVLYADSIRTKILNSKVPVYVFIDNNAASAGALISIACDKIFMRKGASIGAATVVLGEGQEAPDKYQSYMRATIRATAEAQGKEAIINGKDTTYRWKRDPLIAEAMVDDRTVVPGLIDSGKTLTLTTEEAIKYRYCEGSAENIDELITQNLNIKDYELASYEPTNWDYIKGFLASTIFRSILIMLIIGGIYFELQTPGIGFPLVVSITAAILYFAPLYIDGFAQHWEILLFVVGLVLLVIEIFVIPGFGIAGIGGIGLIVTGLVLSMVNNDAFNFDKVEAGSLSKAIIVVLTSLVLSAVGIVFVSWRIGTDGMFKRMALDTNLKTEDGYIGVSMEQKDFAGKEGIASTDLRPSGKIKIDDISYDAISIEGYIEKGTLIKVSRYETGQLYVEKKV